MARFKKWCAGLIVAAVIGATAVGLFYAEELHRGKRAWENCRRELAANGVKLNWGDYLPGPVADDENVFGVPEMQQWFDGYDYGVMARLAPSKLPKAETLTPESATSFLQSNAKFDHDFELVRQALQRPYSRIRGKYNRMDHPPAVSLGTMFALVRTLVMRAKCHILLNQSEAASGDIMLIDDMSRGLLERQKPVEMLTVWVDSLGERICTGLVRQGIRSNCWNQAQLGVLEDRLQTDNVLKVMSEACALERAVVCCQNEPPTLARLAARNYYIDKDHIREGDWNAFMARILPGGWAYLGGAERIETDNTILASIHAGDKTIDLKALKAAIEKFQGLSPHWAPKAYVGWSGLGIDMVGQRAAYVQTQINQATLACALERCRLAQGGYPATLDALAPRYIEKIPRDVIDGLPLHYQRSATNTFSLYSIGWNGHDDGGTRGSEEYPYTNGDWVW